MGFFNCRPRVGKARLRPKTAFIHFDITAENTVFGFGKLIEMPAHFGKWVRSIGWIGLLVFGVNNGLSGIGKLFEDGGVAFNRLLDGLISPDGSLDGDFLRKQQRGAPVDDGVVWATGDRDWQNANVSVAR